MKDKWNERYANEAYAYGIKPNNYLAHCLAKFTSGKILFAAEGEGRNAAYAAQKAWDVSAFDISEEGKKKADKLAAELSVTINYQVGDYNLMGFKKNQFDAIGGPDDINMLFSTEELMSDFQNFEIINLEEIEVELQEGLYHNGIGSVIRFLGLKK